MADRTSPRAPTSTPAPPEPSRSTRLAGLAAPGDVPVQLGFVAPGGSGSDDVLATIARRMEEAGGRPVRMTGRRLERTHPLGALTDVLDPGEIPGSEARTAVDPGTEQRCRDLLLDRLEGSGDLPAVLLVDDAQWLDEATLRILVGLAERAPDRGVSLVASHRPVSGDPNIAALDAALSRRQPLVWLGPLTEEDVSERVAMILGNAVKPAVVEGVHEQTAGMPALVDLLARSWAGQLGSTATAEDLTVPSRDELAPAVVAAIRTEVDQLPPTTRTVLAALSAGADLDDDLLGTVTGLGQSELVTALDMLRSAGLLVADADEVVPVVAAAVSELTPVADRRRFHAALAAALTLRGAPPMQAAEHLAAARAVGKDAAETYLSAGEACLADAPELARTWFDRAAAAGVPAPYVTARQAEAAALDGDTTVALRLADVAVGDPVTPDRERALGVVAALLPARGFWGRAASAYRELSQDGSQAPELLALIGSVVAGTPDAQRPLLPAGDGSSSLELEALTLTARGLVASLDDEPSRAEAPFLEAAELLESGHNRLLLPDSPHALGATVALALCDLTAAEHMLTRALEQGVGGRALQLRHRLLLGWVAVRSGRWSAAQAVLDETRNQTLAPREMLLSTAIDAGLARRGGDLTRLGDAWRQAEGVLLRHPADLLTLDAIGELAIAASRLGQWDRVSGKAHELGDVLRASGEPPLWALPLRWTGLQVALASDDHEAVIRRATEVASIRPVHPRLSALAEAAATWVDVISGSFEPKKVSAAAKGLQDLSLTWEASRLTGQAAIRSEDPSVTRALLEQARDLKAALPSAEADEIPSTASALSEREQMVAQHIMDGLTYKEIGAQLYISPKTVEHHVAKIRQKLGATTRAEMLAALRNL